MWVLAKVVSPARSQPLTGSGDISNDVFRMNVSALCEILMVVPVWVQVPAMSSSKTDLEPVAAIWRWPDVVPSAFRFRINVLPTCNSLVCPVPPTVTQRVGA